jgi:lipopolysaccharide transport system ATP-binding protein
MSDLAIRVEHLGKQYRIGSRQAGSRTFREAILDSFAAPVRWMRGHRKKFETFWALDDVSFEIEQGEAVGIIGRNGAGKSTLLKILSRITKPTRGRVNLYGRVASLLEVGTGFHSELSGRDNIYLNGAVLGMTRREIDRKFDEIVDFSGVEKFLDTPVKHYSSGMYVRLAFAVAAHLQPEILLVDEVLAVGDAEFQKKCLGKMDDVARSGRTVLFVSHNMGAIESLCRTSICLAAGAIAYQGETKDAVKYYMSSTNANSLPSISLRKDRVGSGKLVFEDLQIDDSQIRNRSIQIVLSLRNRSEEEFDNVLLSVVVNDHLGRPISNLVNQIIGRPISVKRDGSKVKLTINNMNLVPGTYGVSVFASSDQHNGEIFDWVTHAAEFDVPDYDYYSKGYIPYIKGETIYMDYDYEKV